MASMDFQPISDDAFLEKYAKNGEDRAAQRARVAKALASVESKGRKATEKRFAQALHDGFVPGGRIQSGAGTGLQVTLINCFVQPVHDSMDGIAESLRQAMLTLKAGGGVGYDFSPIRPKGALVKAVQAEASGPISFMRVFDRACETIESAGYRRGAQMGVLRVDHPDIREFIEAKYERGQLSNFNVSVGVTDAFMQAVEDDGYFELMHESEPAPRRQAGHDVHFDEARGKWIYERARAREIWDYIMEATYDHADPGVLFLDRINDENNLWYAESIQACNPCVTGDTWVHTADGPRQVEQLIGEPTELLVNGRAHASTEAGFFATGHKPVLRLVTREGQQLRLTEDHPVLRRVYSANSELPRTEWAEAGELTAGDEVVLHDHGTEIAWPGAANADEGYLLGLLLGDGHLGAGTASLRVATAAAATGDGTVAAHPVMQATDRAIQALAHRGDFGAWATPAAGDALCRDAAALRELAGEFDLAPGAEGITPAMERASSEFYRGFLRGLFDTHGDVEGTRATGVSVRLTLADRDRLVGAQRMLARLGIGSALATDGGSLVIDDGHVLRFAEGVGFTGTAERERLRVAVADYLCDLRRPRWHATVERLDADGAETVYDVEVPGVHAFDANGIYVHNCGEQMLPAFGCCCLGSINLTNFVEQPFADGVSFDFERFGSIVRTSVQMLDNVLDATAWPLPEQAQEAEAKRRVGLGYLGLGDTLIMLGLRYDSEAGRDMAARISRVMRDEAYRASVELAKSKGAFPLFDADKFLEGEFARRLPADLRSDIREHGIRNSHLMSIAPTGTITLAFADNASNGIEPPFSWTYARNKRMPDDTTQRFDVEDHAFRVWRHQGNDPGAVVKGRYANLPESFVSALEMRVEDHMQMIAAVQPFIDSAISKTCNVPADYDYGDFRELYSRAWRAGAKGLTTFRPNDVTGAVLETSHDAEQPADFDDSDADRRLRLDKAPQPALASLRWQNRPTFADGNPAKTYMVNHPGGKFAVFVGYTENGPTGDTKHPFEMWVNGAEQPRGAGAIAKALSMDMRTRDAAWLKAKLDSLARVHDQPFEMPLPPKGEPRHVPSAVAGMALLVRHCCEELGTFDRGEQEHPVLDALMSPKEPKTGPNGTMSWTVDIHNPSTGDDFVLGLKELALPDGERRPYSLWLAGEYPRTLDGLCKVLSYDMRVIDPAWIGAKLRTLVDFPEAQGDFMAWVPGGHRQAIQPSTVAYIARLMIHRYHQLGILDEEGFPMRDMEVMFTDSGVEEFGDNVVPMQRAAGANEVTPGRRCGECGNYAMIKRDGCDFCTACGAQGGCG
jgi:ribonucleoside-diphosphate reductase alpha chain